MGEKMANPGQRNFKLTLTYEGTRYAGFQKQAGQEVPTIQGALEMAILKLTGETVRLTGAGRTDAGVHARGQVVNFYSQARLTAADWQQALNATLPRDILVGAATEVKLDFHARYDAKSKTYSYRIHNDRLRPVFDRNLTYFYRRYLNLELMRAAAALIVGQHDFRSFQAAGSTVKTTVRTVNFCELTRWGSELRLIINADGFLYHMVRNIIGTLIFVGNGRLTVTQFDELMRRVDRNLAGPTAPALGLCLEKVFY
jgi:tRNA pseudouridine38-40 synthase